MPRPGSVALERRAQVLPQQPAAAHIAARACRCHQGALGLRASPPAAQGRTGAWPLRGSLLDRPAPARPDELHRVCLSAALAPRRTPPDGAGKKPAPVNPDHRRSRACPPSVARSSAGCSPTSSRLSDARIAATSSSYRLTSKCPGSAREHRLASPYRLGSSVGTDPQYDELSNRNTNRRVSPCRTT